MPFIKCQINVPTLIDGGKNYIKKYDEAVNKMVRAAAVAFMQAAMAVVPQRTGFARGSLKSIGQAAGRNIGPRLAGEKSFQALLKGVQEEGFDKGQMTALDVLLLGRSAGVVIGRQLEGQRREYYYPSGGNKVLKTPLSGTQFGTPIDKIIRKTGQITTFTYHVDISYYSIQDIQKQRSPTSPWRSFLAGNIAFEKIMLKLSKQLENYPEISGFLEVNTITVDSNGHLSSKRRLFV